MPLNAQLKDSSKNTIAVLDGVRGFACLLVIAYHINRFSNQAHIWTTKQVGPIVSSFAMVGSCGVTLFFVLSGFLLFLPYAKSLLFREPWPSMRTFYLRRIFRIWPGYFFALALLILLVAPAYAQPDHWKQLLLFITFFMDSSNHTYQAINGPFWTLAVEWQYYLLLPFIALGIRWFVLRSNNRRRVATLFICLLMMVIWGVGTRAWGRSWDVSPDQQMWLPLYAHRIVRFFVYGESGKYLEDFAVGMMICTCYLLIQRYPELTFNKLVKRYSWGIWLLGVAGFCFLTAWYLTPLYSPLVSYIGAHNWLGELSFAVSFGLAVLGLIFAHPVIRWIWESAPLRNLGMLSYGLYIWHEPMLFWFMNNVFNRLATWPDLVRYGLYWLCILVVLIPLCYGLYRVVELPWIQVGAHYTRKKRVVISESNAEAVQPI